MLFLSINVEPIFGTHISNKIDIDYQRTFNDRKVILLKLWSQFFFNLQRILLSLYTNKNMTVATTFK